MHASSVSAPAARATASISTCSRGVTVAQLMNSRPAAPASSAVRLKDGQHRRVVRHHRHDHLRRRRHAPPDRLARRIPAPPPALPRPAAPHRKPPPRAHPRSFSRRAIFAPMRPTPTKAIRAPLIGLPRKTRCAPFLRPRVVIGPCPGQMMVSSGSEKISARFVRNASAKLTEPPPIEPAKSASPTTATGRASPSTT